MQSTTQIPAGRDSDLERGATPRLVGHMYIAKRLCGRVSAMAWDDVGHEKDTAKSVAEWIKRGDTVERVARHEGEPLPEMICMECRGKPCVDAAIARATQPTPLLK